MAAAGGNLIPVSTDGTTDNTATINNFLSAMGKGTAVLPATPTGSIAINGRVSVPSGVNLTGQGNGVHAVGTTIKCTSASSGVTIGEIGSVTNWGGASGGFTVDGNSVATQPFLVGRCTQRRFFDIDVVHAAAGSAAMLVSQGQNNLFMGVNVETNLGDGIVLDRGTGGHVFLRCEITANAGYNLKSTESAAEGGALYAVPSHIQFYGCLFERRHPTAGGLGSTFFEACDWITFNECILMDSTAVTDNNLIKTSLLAPYNTCGQIRALNCRFFGIISHTTAARVASGTSVVLHQPLLQNLLNAFYLEGAGSSVEFYSGHYAHKVTNTYAGPGDQNAVVRSGRQRASHEVRRVNATDRVLWGGTLADVGERFRLTPTQLLFGDGTGFTQDTGIGRTGAATIGTTGALRINGGTAITKHLSGTATWDPARVGANSQVTTTVTVTGAAIGDTVAVGFSQNLQGMQLTGYVSAANTVTVVLRNGTAGALDLASGTLRADVWQH